MFCFVLSCPIYLSTYLPWKVWGEEAVARAAEHDKADWRVFDAANDILDLRLWTVRTNDQRLTTNDRPNNYQLQQRTTTFDYLVTT
ncbi:MAG: hypothetical protein ABJN74_10935, partial [Gilvibacter sp.]